MHESISVIQATISSLETMITNTHLNITIPLNKTGIQKGHINDITMITNQNLDHQNLLVMMICFATLCNNYNKSKTFTLTHLMCIAALEKQLKDAPFPPTLAAYTPTPEAAKPVPSSPQTSGCPLATKNCPRSPH